MTEQKTIKFRKSKGNRPSRSNALEVDPEKLELKPIEGQGSYTTRSGHQALITGYDGVYYFGHIQKGRNKISWRWFPNGATYGQFTADDLVRV